MPTEHEAFWTHSSFAFVGDSANKPFPKLSYRELKKHGDKRVFAVDPSAKEIEGDQAYPDFGSLPEPVEAAVLEVPKQQTAEWVRKAADAGVKHLWIHMGRETPEAVALAEERGLSVLTGTCAVMYVRPGFSYHSLHKWINQLLGKY
jgi:predicted CoA-binding protein